MCTTHPKQGYRFAAFLEACEVEYNALRVLPDYAKHTELELRMIAWDIVARRGVVSLEKASAMYLENAEELTRYYQLESPL